MWMMQKIDTNVAHVSHENMLHERAKVAHSPMRKGITITLSCGGKQSL
jgi:hypothetical protein